MIVPGTMRDYSFIAANMRPDDLREIMAQIPDGSTPMEIAAWSLGSGEAWTALADDGQPVAAFGASPMTPAGNCLSIWMWGTERARWTAGAIRRFIADERVPAWIDAGCTRIEARSIVGHSVAHAWLRRLGFDEVPCPEWGRHGEGFILFSWTKSEWLKTREDRNMSAKSRKDWMGKRRLHQSTGF